MKIKNNEHKNLQIDTNISPENMSGL